MTTENPRKLSRMKNFPWNSSKPRKVLNNFLELRGMVFTKNGPYSEVIGP